MHQSKPYLGVVHDLAQKIVQQEKPFLTLDAPPGSGKTATIVEIVQQLQHDYLETGEPFDVAIACSTRAQVFALGRRLLPLMLPGVLHMRMSTKSGDVEQASFAREIKKHNAKKVHPTFRVDVMTVARLAMRFEREPEYGLIIIDEAYQSSATKWTRIWNKAFTILTVGDPGQIGPVNRMDKGLWGAAAFYDPTPRMQDAIKQHNSDHKVFSCNLTHTMRLGPVTTKIVRSLYEFPFTSLRPDRHIEVGNEIFDEIEWIDSFTTKPLTADASKVMVADYITDYIQRVLADGWIVEGDKAPVPLTQGDVAILASTNSTVAACRVSLKAAGLADVVVLTADSAQGLEWPFVIAIDPLGPTEQTYQEHHSDIGRLTVLLSRHNNHLTWVGVPFDNMDVEDIKSQVKIDEQNFSVREALTDVAPCYDKIFEF